MKWNRPLIYIHRAIKIRYNYKAGVTSPLENSV